MAADSNCVTSSRIKAFLTLQWMNMMGFVDKGRFLDMELSIFWVSFSFLWLLPEVLRMPETAKQ
jgi:hypothetical protein